MPKREPRENSSHGTLSEAIGYSLDVEIDDYALVNMQGFTGIIDAVGGVTLDLSEMAGLIPHELRDRTPFPRVGASPYFLSLGPHGYYWMKLQGRQRRPARYGIEESAI